MGICLSSILQASNDLENNRVPDFKKRSTKEEPEEEMIKEEAIKPMALMDRKSDLKLSSVSGNEGLIEESKTRITDFEFLKVLGRGSFGKVLLVEKKDTKTLYAMKIVRKVSVEQRNQKIHAMNEREIMERINHPFFVQLHYAFQSEVKLYLVMDFMIGGELFLHLRKSFKFTEEQMRFYACEIVLGLEYLHSQGIIYRDLKPENILINRDGHIALTDFGLSKAGMEDGQKAYTFCGTPEYVAPEIIYQKGHDRCADYYSLGVLLYEMLSGAPPFYSKDKKQMIRNRLEKPIEMKPWFSSSAISLLQGLLAKDPKYRLGANGISEIKEHYFFEEIDWESVYEKRMNPSFIPEVQNHKDLKNFDQHFLQQPILDTPITSTSKMEVYEKYSFNKYGS